MVLLALLLACARPGGDTADTGGDTAVADTDTAAADTDTAGDDTDTAGDDTDTGPGWWEAPPGDADGDGFTAAQGDCDEVDATVHPAVAADTCDGRDADCDGAIDEDAPPDAWEPNDTVATVLGDLTDTPETLRLGQVFPAGDVDRFAFYVADVDFSWFSVEAWLTGVPADADYRLALVWTSDADGDFRGTVATADDEGDGGFEVLDWGGLTGRDDGGWYEVVVDAASGAGCATPYTLQILVGGL